MRVAGLLAPISIAALAAIVATGCSDTGVTNETGTVTDPITSTPATSVLCTEAGINTTPFTVASAMASNTTDHELASDYTYSSASAVSIALNGTTATVTGTGATVSGSTVTITAAGTYQLAGTLTDGQVIVNTSDTGTVRVVLNGVTLTNSGNAAIVVNKAKKAVLLLAAGTTNRVTDGLAYPTGIDPNAAIFSKANLSIGGTGTLIVTGRFEDGITGKDGLVIAGGNITVTAKDDGIRGKDYLVIRDGTFTVNAGGDGIKSDEEDDAALGYVRVQGGTFNITSGGDAISAETDALIAGGSITAKAAGGSSARISDTLSAKAVKGGILVIIDGGALMLDAADDGLHSNGRLIVNGGTVTVATADDGVHADSALTINAGTISVTKSYEGIEVGAADMVFNGGTIRVASSDDGINLAGGATVPRMGGGGTSNTIRINAGRIVVNAAGDGVDSNGSIAMSGGCVLVNGPTASNNAPLDYDGSFAISGGFFVATGSAGMAQAPGATSAQASMLLISSSTRAAGTMVHLQSSTGATLLDFVPSKPFQSIAFSSPAVTRGGTYQLYLGGSNGGTATDGWYDGGMYTGGTLVKSLAIGSASNRITF